MDKCNRFRRGNGGANPLSMRTSKTLIVAMLLLANCAQNSAKKQPEPKPNYSNVDYSAGSNIIEYPEKLTGDEKAIFYHPFFLKLTSEETRNLDPFKVKEEFEKLGITTKQRARFVSTYSFLKTDCWAHKKSCENWEYFKFLKPTN